MFWHSSSLDGCKAVSGWPVSAVMQTGDCLLSSSKQSDLAPAVLPAHAVVLRCSRWPRHLSAFLQETSARPAGICHPRPDQHRVSGRALPSCLLPPEEGRSFPRLRLLREINASVGQMLCFLAGWAVNPLLSCSLSCFSSHFWRCRCCLGFPGQGWCLIQIALSCLHRWRGVLLESECASVSCTDEKPAALFIKLLILLPVLPGDAVLGLQPSATPNKH